MYKVKLTFPYPHWDLIRQTSNSKGIWGNYQFLLDDNTEECDFWFVFNHLSNQTQKVSCAKKNTVLLTGEPFVIQRYNPDFLNQFGNIITCQREINHPSVSYFHQGHNWFVGASYEQGKYTHFSKSYDELIATEFVKKTKQISIITSDKLFTDGHKRRYEFAIALKEYFGNVIDLYGRGVNDFADKWDVLADYKYSIAIENFVCPDWFTEKIYDCYLAHTLPLYYGCPNIQDYFSSNSYDLIDINDLDNSKRKIETLLNDESYYEKKLPYILDAKIKYLNNYNIFPLVTNFIENNLKVIHQKKTLQFHNNYLYQKPKLSLWIDKERDRLGKLKKRILDSIRK